MSGMDTRIVSTIICSPSKAWMLLKERSVLMTRRTRNVLVFDKNATPKNERLDKKENTAYPGQPVQQLQSPHRTNSSHFSRIPRNHNTIFQIFQV